MEIRNADRSVLRCPACGAPLSANIKKRGRGYCDYCQREVFYRQEANGSILYSDRRFFSVKESMWTKVGIGIGLLAVIVLILWNTGNSAMNNGSNSSNTGRGSHSGQKDKTFSDAHRRYLTRITTEEFEWPDNMLGKTVPEASFSHGYLISDSEESFSVDIGNVSKSDFEEYRKECQNAGFEKNSENAGMYFHAYDVSGYELQLSYDEDDQCMSIIAHAPKHIDHYEWPQTGLATLLPVPESEWGEITTGEKSLEATIYYMEKAEFDVYTDACIKAGFDREYDKSIDLGYFKGRDVNGYELTLRYQNDFYHTMTIILE